MCCCRKTSLWSDPSSKEKGKRKKLRTRTSEKFGLVLIPAKLSHPTCFQRRAHTVSSVLGLYLSYRQRFPGMGWLPCLCYLTAAVVVAIGSERRQHQVQHGPCRYTFILPEVEQCRPAGDFQVTNSLQRDSPSAPESPHAEPTWQERKLETLESATENNTQWLQKVVN